MPGPDVYYALVGLPSSPSQVRALYQHSIPIDAIVYLAAAPPESNDSSSTAIASLPHNGSGDRRDDSPDGPEVVEPQHVAGRWGAGMSMSMSMSTSSSGNARSFAAGGSYLGNKDSPFQHIAIITVEQVYFPFFLSFYFYFHRIMN